jgi:hypothetical protein
VKQWNISRPVAGKIHLSVILSVKRLHDNNANMGLMRLPPIDKLYVTGAYNSEESSGYCMPFKDFSTNSLMSSAEYIYNNLIQTNFFLQEIFPMQMYYFYFK